ncbi:tRNA (N(6)-L-threonylcarbamoyladenosine(37)-C(2))-methylthiotransferase [Candidatus Marsarchaeota archaeon]|nr:tRNA (N(6)-L-threonylcarbamoyladenosine(37)-C(2))-methylthiotransferase [Candidatus Marsarchaeota archaeon]MCL5404666.1 tRNA (N(6)-L-threonylcarbamoyladenosine(37)-C(2))-methylthiotransferase [Candidatus Marsarchaeota archaeon]
MKVYIETYGCTLNQADSGIISSAMSSNGVELCNEESDADVVLLNTCTVKGATQNRIVYRLKELERSGKRMIVTGCMAGANSDIIERYAPSASIATIHNVESMPRIAHEAFSGNRILALGTGPDSRLDFYAHDGSVIAKVPLSDGCLSSCSFCETKFARGSLHSFDEDMILQAVAYSVRNGAREVDLTAQDTGAYGIDRGTNIARLAERLGSIDGSFKARIGMLNPEHLHRYMDELIDALKSEKLYKFLHLPLQSGSDSVLKAMRRGYTVDAFMGYVKELRKKINGITIETDIIVGYPTETEDDFDMTVSALKDFRPYVTNISKFTKRPHASASQMKQLAPETINERSAELSRLVRSMQAEDRNASIGEIADVLLTEKGPSSLNGRDGSYRQVVMQNGNAGAKNKIGDTVAVQIYAATSNALYGRIEE